jgi:hypothetical protein
MNMELKVRHHGSISGIAPYDDANSSRMHFAGDRAWIAANWNQ